jgi:hypothetical protein
VWHLPFELVVTLDRERHEHLEGNADSGSGLVSFAASAMRLPLLVSGPIAYPFTGAGQ